jgi:two-component system, NarL family, nitrate/nitrite response regulator NarL
MFDPTSRHTTLRIVLIEDQTLFADIFRQTLELAGLNVAGVFSNGSDGLNAVWELQPDVVLIDLGLPDRHGLEVGKEILRRLAHVKVIALSAHDDPLMVHRAMRAGFAGYLTKNTSTAEFLRDFQAIAEGRAIFRHCLVSSRRPSDGQVRDATILMSELTEREREVLSFIAAGATSRVMSNALGVSINTVRSHVQAILIKLQLHSRLEVAAFALRTGLMNQLNERRDVAEPGPRRNG